MASITQLFEMRDNLKFCYRCQKIQACLICEYNKNKLVALQFVTEEIEKRNRKK